MSKTLGKTGIAFVASGAVVAVLGMGPLARASELNAHTISSWNFHGSQPDKTDVHGPVDRVVAAGVELAQFGHQNFVSIDFSDTQITITANIDQPFGYFESLRFSDTNGLIPPFETVAIDGATDWNGFNSSDVYVADDYFDLNLTALYGLQGQKVVVNVTLDQVCQEDLGSGGPGTSVLSVCGGDLSSGTTANLLLEQAPPSAPAFLVVGLFNSPTPFKGGTLVPVPPLFLISFIVDANGYVFLPGIAGGSGPATVFAQFVVLDPSQSLGIGLSNAVEVDILP